VFGVHFVFVILLCFLLGNTRYFTPRCVIHCRPLTPSPLCVPPLFSFHCQSVQTHSHHTSEHTPNNTNTHTRAKRENLRVYIFWFANGKRMKTSKIFAVCRRVCSYFIWTTTFICETIFWNQLTELFLMCAILIWYIYILSFNFWLSADDELLMTPCWGRAGCCGFRPVSDCYLQPVIHLQQCQEVALETLRARLLSPIVLPLIRRMMNV
jgi:hypothetical protein